MLSTNFDPPSRSGKMFYVMRKVKTNDTPSRVTGGLSGQYFLYQALRRQEITRQSQTKGHKKTIPNPKYRNT
jgi:hypothetical protein